MATTLYSSLLLPWGPSSVRKADPLLPAAVSLFPAVGGRRATWLVKKKAATVVAAVRPPMEVKYMGTYRQLREGREMTEVVLREYKAACEGEKADKKSDRCLKAQKFLLKANKILWDRRMQMVECRGRDPLEAFCKEHPESEDCQPISSLFMPFYRAVAALPEEQREAVMVRAKVVAEKLTAKYPGRGMRRGTVNRRQDLEHEELERLQEMGKACEGKDPLRDKGCVAATDAWLAALKTVKDFKQEIKESDGDPLDAFCEKNPDDYLCDFACEVYY